MAKGKIMSAPFEEGDAVKKDDVLYSFDARDVTILSLIHIWCETLIMRTSWNQFWTEELTQLITI